MSTKIRNRVIQGLEKSDWKYMTFGRGRHGWAFHPPQGVTSDHNIKFITVSQDVDEGVAGLLEVEIRRFYRLIDGKKVYYSRDQAAAILSGKQACL